jgi:hypothetical protein
MVICKVKERREARCVCVVCGMWSSLGGPIMGIVGPRGGGWRLLYVWRDLERGVLTVEDVSAQNT